MNENEKNALVLLNRECNGILSTHSIEVEGYPFGSVTPYCLDQNFNPIILVSDLAQHTKNMNKDQRISLTITQNSSESEKQTLGRYTYLGDAKKIEGSSDDYNAVSKIYLRYFPQAKHYFEAHNFDFYRLNFKRGRYIEGFGKIYWIENENSKEQKNVLTIEDQEKIFSHMNADHLNSLKKYCSNYKNIEILEDDKISMVGIYQFGFDLLHNKEKLYFPFEEEITDMDSARTRLVHMAKA